MEPKKLQAGGLENDRLSESSSAVSEHAAAESKIAIPAQPTGALESEFFECPYCYDILKVSGLLSWE